MSRWQPKQRDPEKRIVHKYESQSSSESHVPEPLPRQPHQQSQPRSSQSKQIMNRCDICSMDVCSVNWKHHIRGKRHKKAMAQRLRCDICGVQSSCESTWKEHMQGKRHKNAVQEHASANQSKVSKPKNGDHFSKERHIQNRSESISASEDQKCIENHQNMEITQWFQATLLKLNRKNKIGTLKYPTELKAYAQNKTASSFPSTISFDFSDCVGMNVFKLKSKCMLEFRVTRNDHDDGKEFKVIKVRIPYLAYRWQRFDVSSKEWHSLSRAKSVDLETQYTRKLGPSRTTHPAVNDDNIRRITRFKGKVLRIDQDKNCGLVQINYPDEYGEDIGIWFNFKDCKKLSDSIKVRDDVEYSTV